MICRGIPTFRGIQYYTKKRTGTKSEKPTYVHKELSTGKLSLYVGIDNICVEKGTDTTQTHTYIHIHFYLVF